LKLSSDLSASLKGNNEMVQKILVVDDVAENIMLLADILTVKGYEVITAQSGAEALVLINNQNPDLVLLDVMMPEMTGYEVCQAVRADPAICVLPIILVTALDPSERIKGLEVGADDFLTKPINRIELLARVRSLLRIKELYDTVKSQTSALAEWNRTLEMRVAEQVHQLQDSYEKLQESLNGSVLALSSALERRDPYTAGHQRRVSLLACAIAKEMGLPENQIEGVRVAGILHDIGKICVPADILCKPGQISASEFGVIKDHPGTGFEILQNVVFPWPIAQIVKQHQERLDGSGYPSQLSGEDILIEARIIGVADVVEAMATQRPYRAAFGLDLALEEIATQRGSVFDAVVVDACLKLFNEKLFNIDL
jgi:putative two-component system response regulator